MAGNNQNKANYEIIQIGKNVYKKAEFGPKVRALVSKSEPGQFLKIMHTTLMRKTEGKKVLA